MISAVTYMYIWQCSSGITLCLISLSRLCCSAFLLSPGTAIVFGNVMVWFKNSISPIACPLHTCVALPLCTCAMSYMFCSLTLCGFAMTIHVLLSFCACAMFIHVLHSLFACAKSIHVLLSLCMCNVICLLSLSLFACVMSYMCCSLSLHVQYLFMYCSLSACVTLSLCICNVIHVLHSLSLHV